MSQQFQPGDRITTPSGRAGEILEPAGGPTMPNHALVLFDEVKKGFQDRQWILADLLSPEDEFVDPDREYVRVHRSH